jgi:RNA polymerase sigma factor (sigma-70 family)
VGLADAEDAAQEALLRAWRAWGDLRDEEAVRAWLLRITVNVCRNWQAGRFGTHRRRIEPLGEAEQDAPPAALIRAGPGTLSHTAALDLRHAVTRLPADLRQIVALRFYAGMDVTEIGLALEAVGAQGVEIPAHERYPDLPGPGSVRHSMRLPLGIHRKTGKRYPLFDAEGLPCAFTSLARAVTFVLATPVISAAWGRKRNETRIERIGLLLRQDIG